MHRQKSNINPTITEMQPNSILGKYMVDPAEVK